KISFEHNDYLAGLRKQWGFIQMLTKQSTQLLNQLESLLYCANTEILSYCKDGVPKWVLKLILSYPTAVKLAEAKAASVAETPYISRQRAEQLIAAAKQSIASANDNITGQVVSATARQILALKATIAEQTQFMAQQCALPEVELLKSFTGIGEFSAIGLLLQIQSITRFASVKKLASFLGLHPVYKMSGDGIGGIHMSKAGRKEARQILFMVALNAIQSNPLIRDIYQERIQKGMAKMAAIGLCMHKIARILYGILKNNKPFDPEIDRQNRQRSPEEKTTVRPDKNRRFQAYDKKAPISRRQQTKRMERETLAHSDNVTKCGLDVPVPIYILP
ncbi:MAG: transposase, partial [Desulfocapsaceae bacterium]|nr:transposase [Desulfocapsaceae bacterium]